MQFVSLEELSRIFRDRQSIAISGMSGVGYPPEIIKAIIESGAKDLTLVYIENNSLFDQVHDDVTEIIKNGQCKKIICSHLGKLSLKENLHYVENVDVEVLPMGTLSLKLQAGANGIPGIMLDKSLVEVYRDKEYIEKNILNGMVFEEAINCDIGCSLVENISDNGLCQFDRKSQYNSGDILRCAEIGIVEYENLVNMYPRECDIEHCWVDYAIKGNGQSLRKS